MNDTSLFERLEDRTLLAVSAVLGAKRGILTINGGAADDVVNIVGTGVFGELTVSGIPTPFSGVKSITINLAGGDDTLTVSALNIGGSFSANLGLGTDKFFVNLDPNPDPAVITAPVFIGGSVTVNLGGNAGDVSAWRTNAANGITIGGDVTLSGVVDVNLDGTDDNSERDFGDINVGGLLKITLSGIPKPPPDDAQLFLDNVNVGGRTILTGGETNEIVRLSNCTFTRQVEITLKGGNDVFDIDNDAIDPPGAVKFNRFFSTVNVNYGLGDDKFDNDIANPNNNLFVFGLNSKNGPESTI